MRKNFLNFPKQGQLQKQKTEKEKFAGVETLKEIVKVKFKDGDEAFFKKYDAKDIKIIKDIEQEETLDVENPEDLKELEELERLEESENNDQFNSRL